MKQLFPTLVFLTVWAGASLSLSAQGEADAAWEIIREALISGPGNTTGWTRQDHLQWHEDKEERIRSLNHDFYQRFPGDDRRWEAVLTLLRRSPRYIIGWEGDAGELGWNAALVDTKAATAWEQTRQTLRAAMLAAPDVPPVYVERLHALPIFAEISGLHRRLENGETVDWPALREAVVSHLESFPDQPAIAGVVSRYMGMFERDHTALESHAEWKLLTTNPLVRENDMVQRRLVVYEKLDAPLEMAFDALDGSRVDLSEMRGKVVLIDFWATWCGPCIAEIPHIKEVYSRFYDDGFRVIGISLDREADKQRLIDFCAAHGLPWPQHFDGGHWRNAIATRFRINSIPAMFLIDKTGYIVSTNARGPRLEQEVRRLLAQ